MQNDARGLSLSTASETAARHYDKAIERYFEYRLDTMEHVKAALTADPDFLMAHCLRGYLFMLFGTTRVYPKVQDILKDCEARLEAGNDRERLHVDALRDWLGGDIEKTCRVWDQILFLYPHDLLALRLSHFATFWMGQSQALRGRVAQIYPAWSEEIPGYGNVLGMMSFGLEESGDYEEAERLGRLGVDLNGDDLWAIHAVAHVLEMQGRQHDGIAWLDYPADAWDDRNPFRGHLWWHLTLYSLELGDYDHVLELYDRSIRTAGSDFYLDIQNMAAMLLRLEFQGIDVGERWQELADNAEAHKGDHVLAFTDLHHMISLVRAGRDEAALAFLADLSDFGRTPDNTAAAVMRQAGEHLAEAIYAYGSGDFARSVKTLLPLRYGYACVGGSHAQRDLFAQLLLEAAIKDGQLDLAKGLAAERAALKPRSFGTWTKCAAVHNALGDSAAAETALRNRTDLIAARGS